MKAQRLLKEVSPMAQNTSDNNTLEFELPYPDTAELKSNQSVRATFRLSANTILALNIVSNQLGVKQKSLFDHLVGDTEALETIARELKESRRRRVNGVQKTFVISRKTLATLQRMADDYEAPRDALVEFSIQRLKPIIEQEKSKLETRKKFAAKIKSELEAHKKLLQNANRELGADDPISEQFSYAVDRLESAYLAIATFVEKSERITELSN